MFTCIKIVSRTSRWFAIGLILACFAAGAARTEENVANPTQLQAALDNNAVTQIRITVAELENAAAFTLDQGTQPAKLLSGKVPSGTDPETIVRGTGTTSILTVTGNAANPLTLSNLILEHADGLVVAGTAANKNGGAITVRGAGALVLDNVVIQNNTANYGGGAIFANRTLNIDITGSTFQNNKSLATSSPLAGAIEIEGDFVGTIRDSRFIDNITAGYEGGAIKTSGNFVGDIVGSQFIGNRSRGTGAAITVRTFDGAIIDCLFENNTFYNGSSAGGGALLADSLTGGILRSRFIGNGGSEADGGVSQMGGAIGIFSYMGSDPMQLSGGIVECEFTRNSGMGGGALYLAGGLADGAIENTLFLSNSASMAGGAIWLNAGEMEIVDSDFIGNHGDRGGAIFTKADVVLRVTDGKTMRIAGNTAGKEADGTFRQNAVEINGTGSLLIDTGSGATMAMTSSIEGAAVANETITVTKKGQGELKLGAATLMTAADDTRAALFTVEEGILHLYGAAESAPELEGDAADIDVVMTDGTVELVGENSVFTLGSDAASAVLSVGGDNAVNAEGGVILKAGGKILSSASYDTSLVLASAGDAVRLENDLEIEVTDADASLAFDTVLTPDDPDTASVLKTGAGGLDLVKQNAFADIAFVTVSEGSLTSGESQTFRNLVTAAGTRLDTGSNAVTVEAGSLAGETATGDFTKIGNGALSVSGPMTVDGALAVTDGVLGVVIDNVNPTIVADSVAFSGGAALAVTGYNGSGNYGTVVVIRTSTVIADADMPTSSSVDDISSLGYDFLYGEVRRGEENKSIVVDSGLYWYHDEVGLERYAKAHGTFKVDDDARGPFTLGTVLSDRDKPGAGDWDGCTLEKTGDGTLELTAVNTHTGGNLVREGTLLASTEGALGSGTTTVYDGAELHLGHDGEVASDIAGGGGMRTMGDLVFTGDMSDHTGKVDVASGSFGLGAAGGPEVRSGASFVLADGVGLYGNGTVGGLRVKSGATVSPGHSIGAITVDGDVVFEAGSFYRVEVDPNSTDADLLAITGTADLGGATVVHVGTHTKDELRNSPIGEWTILTAAGGFGGTRFNDTIAGDYLFLDQALEYRANNTEVVLVITRNNADFLDFATTRNQIAVAGTLNTLDQNGPLYNALMNLQATADMPLLFDQMSGELHPSVRGMLQNADRAFANTLLGRVTDPAIRLPGCPIWAEIGGFGARGKGGDGIAKAKQKEFNATLGAEGQWGGGWLGGGAFRYARSEVKLKDRDSKADIDSYSFALYGGKDVRFGSGSFRLGLAASYGYHDIDAKRHIREPALAQRLDSDYHAHSLQFAADIGYGLDIGRALKLEPFVRGAWNSVWSNRFNERGGEAALHSRREHQGNFSTILGLRFKAPVSETLSLRAGAGWQHLYGKVHTTNRFNFIDSGTEFSITGISVPRDALYMNAGVNFNVTPRFEIGVGYTGLVGKRVNSHGGNLLLQYSF